MLPPLYGLTGREGAAGGDPAWRSIASFFFCCWQSAPQLPPAAGQ